MRSWARSSRSKPQKTYPDETERKSPPFAKPYEKMLRILCVRRNNCRKIHLNTGQDAVPELSTSAYAFGGSHWLAHTACVFCVHSTPPRQNIFGRRRTAARQRFQNQAGLARVYLVLHHRRHFEIRRLRLYKFDMVTVGDTYIVSVSSDKFQFASPDYVVFLTGDETVNFTALP